MSTQISLPETVIYGRRVHIGQPAKRLYLSAAAVFACVLLIGYLLFRGAPAMSLLPTETAYAAGSASTTAQIALKSARVEQRHGYTTVVGEAANLTARPLQNVEAVVEFFDGSQRLLSVESALLEFATVRPGESSPFTVQTRDVPGMSSYRIRFRKLLGASIPSR